MTATAALNGALQASRDRLRRARAAQQYRVQRGLATSGADAAATARRGGELEAPDACVGYRPPSAALLDQGAYPLYATERNRVNGRLCVESEGPVQGHRVAMVDTRDEEQRFKGTRIVWSPPPEEDEEHACLLRLDLRREEEELGGVGDSLALARNVHMGRGARHVNNAPRNSARPSDSERRTQSGCLSTATRKYFENTEDRQEAETRQSAFGQHNPELATVADQALSSLELRRAQLAQIVRSGSSDDSAALINLTKWARYSGEGLRYHRSVGSKALFLPENV
mmetsp:Transcript_19494/g.36026  ORF Transcript_19494/g.36026 Transcript_19494/m.36026 type:complete len:283 (+) Transcript_19494:3-851(+)